MNKPRSAGCEVEDFSPSYGVGDSWASQNAPSRGFGQWLLAGTIVVCVMILGTAWVLVSLINTSRRQNDSHVEIGQHPWVEVDSVRRWMGREATSGALNRRIQPVFENRAHWMGREATSGVTLTTREYT